MPGWVGCRGASRKAPTTTTYASGHIQAHLCLHPLHPFSPAELPSVWLCPVQDDRRRIQGHHHLHPHMPHRRTVRAHACMLACLCKPMPSVAHASPMRLPHALCAGSAASAHRANSWSAASTCLAPTTNKSGEAVGQLVGWLVGLVGGWPGCSGCVT